MSKQLNAIDNRFIDGTTLGEVNLDDGVEVDGESVTVSTFISDDKYAAYGDPRERLRQVSGVADESRGASMSIAVDLQQYADQIKSPDNLGLGVLVTFSERFILGSDRFLMDPTPEQAARIRLVTGISYFATPH